MTCRILRIAILTFVGFTFHSAVMAKDIGITSAKRGIGMQTATQADLQFIHNHIAWWYNWALLPTDGIHDMTADDGAEYVPMIWGDQNDQEYLRKYLQKHPEVHYILGFNEPNFKDQANMTPQQAADNWYKIEDIADEFNLKIVGPAVNYSPGDVDIPGTDNNGSPFEYLDAFFADCSGCRVDYIAIHGYMSSVSSLEQYVEQFHQRYNKPIWLTEWNLTSGTGSETTEQQLDFLAKTTRWLEAQSYVARYAWFIGRTSASANASHHVSLLEQTAKWTALGELYQGIPSTDYYFPLPNRIQAEHAHQIQGFHHRTTTDVDGNAVVELFADETPDAAQGMMKFQVSSDATLNYQLSIAYAAPSQSVISIQLDDQTPEQMTLNNTGGIYFWETAYHNITIPEGRHRMTIRTIQGTPGFNWVEFK